MFATDMSDKGLISRTGRAALRRDLQERKRQFSAQLAVAGHRPHVEVRTSQADPGTHPSLPPGPGSSVGVGRF